MINHNYIIIWIHLNIFIWLTALNLLGVNTIHFRMNQWWQVEAPRSPERVLSLTSLGFYCWLLIYYRRGTHTLFYHIWNLQHSHKSSYTSKQWNKANQIKKSKQIWERFCLVTHKYKNSEGANTEHYSSIKPMLTIVLILVRISFCHIKSIWSI